MMACFWGEEAFNYNYFTSRLKLKAADYSSDGIYPINTKDLLLQELAETPASVMAEGLDFLRYLKTKEEHETLEDQEDIAEAQEVIDSLEVEGTVSSADSNCKNQTST